MAAGVSGTLSAGIGGGGHECLSGRALASLPVVGSAGSVGEPRAIRGGERNRMLPPDPAAPALVPESALLTVRELAALLRINHKTAYAAISAGEIPGVVRIRGRIRIHRATVLRWLSTSSAASRS